MEADWRSLASILVLIAAINFTAAEGVLTGAIGGLLCATFVVLMGRG